MTPGRSSRAQRRGTTTRSIRSLAWALGLSVAVTALGCRSEKKTPVPAAEFGIFFGGQIQERDEIPFELNSAKQRIGFRLVFAEPLAEPTEVRWELSRPGPKESKTVPVSKPDRRVTEFGSATLPAGEQRFEQELRLRPGDPLGLWNVRVVSQEHVLIDRPFTLYDADQRARARAQAKPADAGL